MLPDPPANTDRQQHPRTGAVGHEGHLSHASCTPLEQKQIEDQSKTTSYNFTLVWSDCKYVINEKNRYYGYASWAWSQLSREN